MTLMPPTAIPPDASLSLSARNLRILSWAGVLKSILGADVFSMLMGNVVLMDP